MLLLLWWADRFGISFQRTSTYRLGFEKTLENQFIILVEQIEK